MDCTMLLEKTILLCLYYTSCIAKNTDIVDKSKTVHVDYKVSDYFFDSNYHCYKIKNLFPKGVELKNHIRRCKINYTSPNLFSPHCVFCPLSCSVCAWILRSYTFGTTFDRFFGSSKIDTNCIYHSVDRIEGRKIRAKKGKTFQEDMKCVPKQFCAKNPCKNGGRCKELFYSYVCICKKEFYGKDCSNKAPAGFVGKLSNGIQLWFPLEVTAARLIPFFVTVAFEGEAQVIEVSTSSGYTVRLTAKDKIQYFPQNCKPKGCRCKSEEGCKTAYFGTLLTDNHYLKHDFKNLPILAVRSYAVGFVSHIKLRVFNEKFSKTNPVLEESIQSYTKLRFKTIYFGDINPNSEVSVYAVKDSSGTRFDPGLKGDCRSTFDRKITVNPSSKLQVSFFIKYVGSNWQLLKVSDDDPFSETGWFTSDQQKLQKVYNTPNINYLYHWRFYKMDGLHKMTDKTEANRQFETQNMKCENSESKKLQEPQVCKVKMSPIMDPGDYVMRVTTVAYSMTEDHPAHYKENFQMNYFCYFHVLARNRDFEITGDKVIKRCVVNIDTKGFDKEGELMWTCTVSKGGPCPDQIALNQNKESVSGVKFKDGEYDVCVDWTLEGFSLGKPCVKVIAKNCDKTQSDIGPDLVINCKENCDIWADPDRDVRLGVIDRNYGDVPRGKVKYFIRDEDGNNVPVEYVTKTEGAMESEIRIDLKKLEGDRWYSVIAQVGNLATPPYIVKFRVIELPKNGSCSLNPMEGIKGVTLFNIECFGWQAEGPIIYEFFDKSPEDKQHYDGRMITYSYSGILSKFRLTRGLVVIYLLNENGEGPSVTIPVTLKEFTKNETHVKNLLEEIDNYMEYENYINAMDIMSTSAEILSRGMNDSYYLRELINKMYQIPHNSAESMKLGLSTMQSILVNGTIKGKYKLDDVQVRKTGKILTRLSQAYLKYATKPGQIPRIRASHIEQLSRNLMDCVDMSIIAQDREVTKLGPEEDVNYDVLDNWNVASNDLAESLMIGTYLVGKSQIYSGPGEHITSTEGVTDMRAWVSNAPGLVNVAGNNKTSFVNISSELAKSFDRNHDLMLQYAQMNKDMFWWTKKNINTDVLMVGLAEKLYKPSLTSNSAYYFVPQLPVPIQIYMKVKKLEKTTIRGNVTQLDPNLDPDLLDRILLVHRFVLPPLSRLYIVFKFGNNATDVGEPENTDENTDENKNHRRSVRDAGNETETTTEGPAQPIETEAPPPESPTEEPPPEPSGTQASSLRVKVYYGYRPDWEVMMNKASVVTPENPRPTIPYDTMEREHFYYMAILPDKSVPVNETVFYSFDIYYMNCHVWQNQWVNHYCLVGPETTEERVECRCTHLSIFSGSIFVPPNDINPILDAPLFLTVADNWYVVVFVLVILLIFLILLIWACMKDRKDVLGCNVIVLQDNFPGESYAYLIAVYTGSRLTAGTTAVVGLRLYGDTFASRATVLKCEGRKVLQRDQDDWFLLTNPASLGLLNAVQLWHNNEGFSPDWFCSKIIVYDIQARTQYLFIVDQWLAMEVEEFPDAMVRPATHDEVLNVKRIFLDNSVLGLRENHLHLSVLARHPRSPVDRKQRLMVLMVMIMSTMISSIMFFKVTDNLASTVDDYNYSFGLREFMISVESLLISSGVAFVAMFLFRIAYKQKEVHTPHARLYMPTKRIDEDDLIKYFSSERPVYIDLSTFVAFDEKIKKPRRDMTMFEQCVESIRDCAHEQTLRPVHLASEDSEIEVNKIWVTVAWAFSITVIVTFSYLVMLYGLKFGKIKSLKWLSSLVASEFQDVLLFTPFKIIFVATLLSIAFERATDISAVALNVKEAIRQDLVGDDQYLKNLVEQRKAPTYFPMTDEIKAKKRRRAMRKMKWRIVADFVSVLAYILVLCYIMKILWSGSQFYANTHARDILMATFHGRFIALEDVFNRTQFFSYLKYTFVRSIFAFRWFNDLNFATLSPPGVANRKDWTKDFISKLVGAPRLRQLRVSPSSCKMNKIMLVVGQECAKPWSEHFMDEDIYAVGWRRADYAVEQAYEWGEFTQWMYQEPKNTSVFPLSGKTGTTYPSGGYIRPLSVKREDTRDYATQVEEEHWIDHHTRAVFLELTLFNPNTQLYSQVTAIIEQMCSGLYLTTANVDSVTTQNSWGIINAIYVIFIISLLIRVAYIVNRNGMFTYFKDRLNCYEVLVVIISIMSIICYCYHLKNSSFYVEEFYRKGVDQFFNFKDMIAYFQYSKVCLWVLFCLLVFRLFVSWYFGPFFSAFWYTFFMAKRWVSTMMITLLFYFWVIWRLIGYSMDAKIFYNYRVCILHYKMYSNIFYNTGYQWRTKVFAFTLCCISLLLKTLFFMIFTHYYEIGRRKILKPMQYFNIFTFIVDEIKRIFGKLEEPQHVKDRDVHWKRDIKIPKR